MEETAGGLEHVSLKGSSLRSEIVLRDYEDHYKKLNESFGDLIVLPAYMDFNISNLWI